MKILVSDPVSEQGVALLREHFEVDVITKLPPEELIRIIPQYDALVVRSETKATAEVLDAAVNLKVIGRAGVGVDNIDVPHATRCGLPPEALAKGRLKVFTFYVKLPKSFYVLRNFRRKFLRSVENRRAASPRRGAKRGWIRRHVPSRMRFQCERFIRSWRATPTGMRSATRCG